MKRITSLILIGLIAFSLAYPLVIASDIGITTEQQIITISISNNGLIVEENLKVTNAAPHINMTSIRFWIQQDATNVEILAVESRMPLSSNISGNIRECSLAKHNLSLNPEDTLDIRLTYTLPTNTKYFEKAILYDTESLQITYEEDDLYQGEHLVYTTEESNSVRILLHQPTESPVNIIYIVIIFLLVVFLVALTLLLMRKQRRKVKKSIVESDETLATKKTLLLSLLKDVEKKHRAKDISDETYNKLKEEYKHQAVETMKKLEDIKK